MIVYNVTIKVDHSISEAWITWLKSEHIPEVLGTGCFTDATILRLLETDETDGLTYAIQYKASGMENYVRYIDTFAKEMRDKSFEKWGDKFIAFRSVMQVVN